MTSSSEAYIAGPMRGHPDLNYPAFHKVAAFLESLGFGVINPAEQDAGLPTDVAMRHDYADLVNRADAICLLPGWMGSEGARAEYAVARSLGLRVMVMSPDLSHIAFEGSFEELSDAHLTPIDDEAWRLVYGSRGQSYGPPTQDFGRTAAMWSEIFGIDPEDSLGPLQVAQAMIALKLSRLSADAYHWDSWTDIIGYALCASRVIGEG